MITPRLKATLALPLVAASAIALTAVAASAAGDGYGKHHRQGMMGPGAMQASFEDLDTDGDGQVTKEEMQNLARLRFDQSDGNGDGMLDTEELSAAIAKRMAERAEEGAKRMLDRRDEDGDGLLSFGEMAPKAARADRMFDRLDADGDGSVSAEEFAARGPGKHGHRDGRGMRRWLQD